MSGELPQRTPTEDLGVEINRLGDEISRAQVENRALVKYITGVSEDDLEEAMHRWFVDLLDSGHIPSQSMLRMISAGLKEAWWPDRRQRQRNKEAVWLFCVRLEVDYMAAEKYGNARGARTKAEAEVAKARGLSADGLRKRRDRYRARLRKCAAKREQQRKLPLGK